MKTHRLSHLGVPTYPCRCHMSCRSIKMQTISHSKLMSWSSLSAKCGDVKSRKGSWKHPQTFKLELKKPISMYSMCHKKGIVVSNPWVPEMLYPRRRRACACFSSFFRVLFAVSIGLGSSAKSFPCSSASGFSWKKTHAESWMRLAVTGCGLPPPRMPVAWENSK